MLKEVFENELLMLLRAFYLIMKNTLSVSYSQKFHGKRGFLNLANGGTFQFMFPKYLIQYQNIKLDRKFKI